MAPDQSALFVANANSELRYDSGAISVIPLDRVDAALASWLPADPLATPGYTGDCAPDPDHSETLICDEAELMNAGAGVRIGNFATDIAVQAFPGQGGGVRVFAPTRGDPSVAWADYKDGALHCTGTTDEFALCDDAHRLAQLQNDPDLSPIPEEPFGVFADGPNGFVMVTHLNTGGVTLIASSDGNDNVRVVDLRDRFFAPEPTTGLPGATGIAGRSPRVKNAPSTTGDIVYVGSNTDRRIQTFTVGQLPLPDPDAVNPPDPEAAYLVPGNFFLLTEVGGAIGGSIDTRGMAFSESGDQLYLVNRQPPSLQLYDTSLSPSGFPRNTGIGGIDVCRQASTVTVFDNGTGERAYVTCFQDGQLYVIDPRNLDQPDDILLTGRGPYAVVPSTRPGGRKLLFVSNFLEDTIAVVDVTPGTRTNNRVVLRIGKPRAP